MVEPSFLRLETDKHSGRLSMPRNDDFSVGCLSQIPREIVDFRQRYFFSRGFPNCASHSSRL
jgi:hypothetical protein